METITHSISEAERRFIQEAIDDALTEIELEPVAENISQGVVDKLVSAYEILESIKNE